MILAGSFNPSILSPHWMAREGILSQSEADSADLDVVHRNITRFAVSGLKFDINAERCQIFAEAEPFVRLADIVGNMFLEKLPHTPLISLGINYFIHADLKDWKKRVRFGRMMAPIQPWGAFAENFDSDVMDRVGGLLDLTMQAPRTDGFEGGVRVTLQPSNFVPNGTGIFVQVNDAYEPKPEKPDLATKAKKSTKAQGAARSRRLSKSDDDQVRIQDGAPDEVNYAQICVDKFQDSISYSREIANGILETARNS